MKIAVFGCSHSGIGPRKWNQTWPYFFHKFTGLEISNFAIGGTSTQFQYEMFKDNIDNFDNFIFQFTMPYRLTKQIGSIKQIKKGMYTHFPNMTANNLECSTAGRFNAEYKKWIKNDNGEILGEYQNICKEVSSHEKCLFSFHMIKHNTNVDGIEIMQNNFPELITANGIHLQMKENKKIATYIKEKCKL
jgi:hypothetical protein